MRLGLFNFTSKLPMQILNYVEKRNEEYFEETFNLDTLIFSSAATKYTSEEFQNMIFLSFI